MLSSERRHKGTSKHLTTMTKILFIMSRFLANSYSKKFFGTTIFSLTKISVTASDCKRSARYIFFSESPMFKYLGSDHGPIHGHLGHNIVTILTKIRGKSSNQDS